jgi:cyclopropane-fatty-acyl-phospholipid synthase
MTAETTPLAPPVKRQAIDKAQPPRQKIISLPRNPLFAALERVEYGRLTLEMPDGHARTFSGSKPGPDAHIRLHHMKALNATITHGQNGFAEGYINGEWDSDDLPATITFGLMNAPALEKFFYGNLWYNLLLKLRYWFQNNSRQGSRKNVKAHYDRGNDFYALWLDESMTYSCAIFGDKKHLSLEEAQQVKYRRILDKLGAIPGQHILEIGCGWGGFAEAAARDSLRVTAITLSEPQADYARERMKKADLHRLATVKLADYREISGEYDHIVSIGMFEHVGEKYWPTFFRAIKHHLKVGGKAMIQTITLDDALFEETRGMTGFIEHYVFPGGMLPSKTRFRQYAEKAGLECREMFTFGQDYQQTLTHWLRRFEASIEKIRALEYKEDFIRMWRFYLASCIAAFATKRTDVMQVEITHKLPRPDKTDIHLVKDTTDR